MFLTSLKQTCNECLIKFSENQSAPKLENRKTSPRAPNLLHVLPSQMVGWHNLCSPVSCALPLLDKKGQELIPCTICTEHVYGESNLISHHIDCIPQFTFQIFLCSQSLEPTNDLIDCECLWSKQFWLVLQPSALGWLRILQNTEHAFSQLEV